ncbi:type II secretion system protein GspD [Phycisphaera mikurensis]|uniref:Putative type IV pilus biogenesis protein PilQ n=1 Tax=Phycisphaera mikurensis (strain NBRC 102666 / KCTC 22515 / FYK2301M01) TaxID=1142394 RepID=I0IEA7_PHYMF|nr:putative type IV pilus biogenesis protein PilQ [Phycisphaera mikurensis]MBB6441397.1 type IV pilus assembly protein PilQ [Phycisphaera mikurensis]BAM03595.1 putative type IV pilus biogenesis protein PilQ [Phycisphaera mikurensis NBRC 102666]
MIPFRTTSSRWAAAIGVVGSLAGGGLQASAQDAPPAAAGEPMDLFEAPAPEGESAVEMDSFGKIDLAVKDLEIAKVLQLLSIQSQKNIVTSRNVSGKVSADLYGVSFHDALNAILQPNNFGYEEKGNFIYVYTTSELEERQQAARTLSTRVVRLNYLNGADAKAIASTLLSDAGKVTFNSEAAEGFAPSTGSAGSNEFALSDALIVRDYEENVEQIVALLDELDVRPKQVLIEATILQAALTENNAFGVDFSAFQNLSSFDFSSPLNAIDDLLGGGGPDGDSGGAITSGVGNTGAPGGVKVGYVGDDASVFVRALDQVTDTTVVAKPNVMVLNRMRADLLVGSRLGYLSTTQTETSTSQTVEFLDVGTQLTVRPFVSNEGTVRLELRPSISDGNVVTREGFVIPNETTQELITNIIVENGQTVVIGGLFKEDTTSTRDQVPGLGDIPFLGNAFKGKDDTVERSEVIFLIKTTIVEPQQMTAAGEAATEAIRNKRIGARNGLLPWSNDKLVSSNLLTAREALAAGDKDKALWHANLALYISPTGADALAMKQEITGERIAYHDRSQLESVFADEMDRGLMEINPDGPAIDPIDPTVPMSATGGQNAPAPRDSDWAYTFEEEAEEPTPAPAEPATAVLPPTPVSTGDAEKDAAAMDAYYEQLLSGVDVE